ncbi:MAG: hypothetical protein QOE06_3419 [Thermoleophilaceae bacterium]|nr:hypothetical protein [Thermoleophilaceae bacterium]
MLARTLFAALFAAVILALVSTSSDASQTRGKCAFAGQTISSNSLARLYRRGDTIIGCMWSRDKELHLDRSYQDDLYITEDWFTPRLGGRFAAWASSYADESCKADCPPGYGATSYTVHVADLKAGHGKSVSGLPAGQTLRVNRFGDVTWLARLTGGQREVHAWDADGHRVLDTGPIRTSSYSLRGRALRWANGDVQFHVNLR